MSHRWLELTVVRKHVPCLSREDGISGIMVGVGVRTFEYGIGGKRAGIG